MHTMTETSTFKCILTLENDQIIMFGLLWWKTNKILDLLIIKKYNTCSKIKMLDLSFTNEKHFKAEINTIEKT